MKKYVIGVDIGGTNMKSGIVSDQIEVRKTIPSNASSGREAVLAGLFQLVATHLHTSAVNKWEVAGIGIGTAGYVDKAGRIVHATNNIPGWQGFDLKRAVEKQFGLPTVVVNDCYAIAAGEAWKGASQNGSDFYCIALGTGIGGCWWKNGAPYFGEDGFSGAVGHQIVVYGGKECTCGQSGCWEQYASVSALQRMVADSNSGEGLNELQLTDFFQAAKSGDLAALRILTLYADYIAAGIINILYTLNPHRILIAGAVSQQGEFLADRIRQCLRQRAMPIFLAERFELVTASLGDEAGIVGAAKLTNFQKNR